MSQTNNKTMPIYNMRLAGYLMTYGFVLLDMQRNYHQPEKNVFYFVDSAEIRSRMQEYSKTRKEVTSNGNFKRKSK